MLFTFTMIGSVPQRTCTIDYQFAHRIFPIADEKVHQLVLLIAHCIRKHWQPYNVGKRVSCVILLFKTWSH